MQDMNDPTSFDIIWYDPLLSPYDGISVLMDTMGLWKYASGPLESTRDSRAGRWLPARHCYRASSAGASSNANCSKARQQLCLATHMHNTMVCTKLRRASFSMKTWALVPSRNICAERTVVQTAQGRPFFSVETHRSMPFLAKWDWHWSASWAHCYWAAGRAMEVWSHGQCWTCCLLDAA